GVEPQPPWDAILLDVDNGPDFLIHAENADLYRLPTLEQAYAQLCPGGVLAIWCQGPHAGLWSAVRALTSASREDRRRAVRGRHRIDYVIYSARAPDRGRQQ
ncbi:MAG: hypothetical protein L0H26_01150, partial [Microlunatus sp.]|nr:hypothetical protein [Microlunatus sp.]